MMRKFFVGIFVGVAICALPLTYRPIARVVSQHIYDCAIRVASDVEGRDSSGSIEIDHIVPSGHLYDLCIEAHVPFSIKDASVYYKEEDSKKKLNEVGSVWSRLQWQ